MFVTVNLFSNMKLVVILIGYVRVKKKRKLSLPQLNMVCWNCTCYQIVCYTENICCNQYIDI